MKIIFRLFIIFCIFNLVACSYISTPSFIKNRDKHYLNARSIPPLRIPPGISSQKIHNEYPIADRNYVGSKEVNLEPPGL